MVRFTVGVWRFPLGGVQEEEPQGRQAAADVGCTEAAHLPGQPCSLPREGLYQLAGGASIAIGKGVGA